MGKHIEFYKKYLENGAMPQDGLCNCAEYDYIDPDLLDFFEPTEEDFTKIISPVYWASGMGLESSTPIRLWGFTPLRQTIVLFMAAINNEL